jgi:hypothetical protein
MIFFEQIFAAELKRFFGHRAHRGHRENLKKAEMK